MIVMLNWRTPGVSVLSYMGVFGMIVWAYFCIRAASGGAKGWRDTVRALMGPLLLDRGAGGKGNERWG